MSDALEEYEGQPRWEPTNALWRESAACRGCDPDLFHPRRGEDVTAARDVCAACPVIDDCLAYALENNELIGIWGGTSERERRALRAEIKKERGVPANQPLNFQPRFKHGTPGGYDSHRYHGTVPCESCRAARSEYSQQRKALRAEHAA